MTDARRLTAYEDALRGIAAATIAGRRRPYDLHALQTMLADVEHHLSTLIVLGFVPGDTGRPVTSSAEFEVPLVPLPGGAVRVGRLAGDTCHCDGPPHRYDPEWCRP